MDNQKTEKENLRYCQMSGETQLQVLALQDCKESRTKQKRLRLSCHTLPTELIWRNRADTVHPENLININYDLISESAE